VPRGIILIAIAALLLALGGCGSSDDSSLSKEEFTKQLKQVCQKGGEERRALIKGIAKEYYEERAERATPEYQAENLRKLMATVQATTDEIAAIGLPEGEEKQVEEFIRTREEAAAKVEASPLGTRDNLEQIVQPIYGQAKKLGVGSCDL
jgi:hypothetical protein